GWTVVLTPATLRLDPGDEKEVRVEVTPPAGFTGSMPINITGRDDAGPIGGGALTGEAPRDAQPGPLLHALQPTPPLGQGADRAIRPRRPRGPAGRRGGRLPRRGALPGHRHLLRRPLPRRDRLLHLVAERPPDLPRGRPERHRRHLSPGAAPTRRPLGLRRL